MEATIKQYAGQDERALFEMMEREGPEWEEYYSKRKDEYKAALKSSITYVAYEGDALCGYCRCRDDGGFGIYICDLLVDKKHRGKRIGHTLMARVCADYPGNIVYVMSDVDEYYEKQGYRREGTIFEVIA